MEQTLGQFGKSPVREALRKGSRASLAAFALLAGACTYETKGLPVLPDSAHDARHEAPSKSDYRGEAGRDMAPYDALRKDKAAPDTGKHDSLAKDIPMPDTSKLDGKGSCASAPTGTFSGMIMAGTPQYVGGYRFDYMGKSGSDAVFDISCGGSPVKAGQKCAVGSDTVVQVPADGKKITISPAAAGTSTVNASIAVENT